jgi:hypothetical protein
MSNGSGPIIIRSLAAQPGLTQTAVAELNLIADEVEASTDHKPTEWQALKVCMILHHLLRS